MSKWWRFASNVRAEIRGTTRPKLRQTISGWLKVFHHDWSANLELLSADLDHSRSVVDDSEEAQPVYHVRGESCSGELSSIVVFLASSQVSSLIFLVWFRVVD